MGISGGISANPGTRRPRKIMESDVIEDVSSSASSTGQLVLHLSFGEKKSRICLQHRTSLNGFEKLVRAAFQLPSSKATQIVGLETHKGIVIPVSLICKSPSILYMQNALQQVFRVLVRGNDIIQHDTDTSAGEVKATGKKLSSEEWTGKIVDFVQMLSARGLFSEDDVNRVSHIMRSRSHILTAIGSIVSAEPDPDKLLFILRHVAAYKDEAEVDLVSDSLEVTSILCGPRAARFEEPMLHNILFLIIVRDTRLVKAFKEFCESNDEMSYLDSVAAVDEAVTFTRACLGVLDQLRDSGYLTDAQAHLLAQKVVPPNHDEFVQAAFGLYQDEADFDELVDTLIRICDREDNPTAVSADLEAGILGDLNEDERAVYDDAFESVLEGLILRGAVDPVDSAWLLGRRAAEDASVANVYDHLGSGNVDEAEKSILQLAEYWKKCRTDNQLDLNDIIKDIEAELSESEASTLWTLVQEANTIVISAYEAFAFDYDITELHDTLKTIAKSYLVDHKDGGTDSALSQHRQHISLDEVDEIIDDLIQEFRRENGFSPTEEHLQKWMETLREYIDTSENSNVNNETNTHISVDEDDEDGDIQFFQEAIERLVNVHGLSEKMSSYIAQRFYDNDDNIRAAFKVYEITGDDNDFIQTLLLIIFGEDDEGENEDEDELEHESMATTLLQVTANMLRNTELSVDGCELLKRLVASKHDRILQIWENYSEDGDMAKLEAALKDISHKTELLDALYDASDMSSSNSNEDDNSEDDEDEHPCMEDEDDEDEDEDEDVKGLSTAQFPAETTITDSTLKHFEELEIEDSLEDAFEIMEPEEVEFLVALRKEQADSHFDEVITGAAHTFGYDQDLNSFVETLRILVSHAMTDSNS
jgi:hypothetical protein